MRLPVIERMNPESIYQDYLESIERIARFVARRAHLNPDDADDFVQIVHLRLLENDYAIIRKFEKRSSFTTYLTTVIARLYSQWRVEEKGKWRPSAEARRLGDTAITLERLTTRDGYTLSEAISTMTMRSGTTVTVVHLEALYARLPNRTPRPGMVSGEVSPDAAAVESDADMRVEARDHERTARRTEKILDAALESFDPEDRLILQLRIRDGLRVPEIAGVVGVDQKKVYKRLDKLYAALHRALEADGVSLTDVTALFGSGDHEIHLKALSSEENSSAGPSHDEGEDDRGGKGRLP